MKTKSINRRQMLRGLCQGTAVSIGLPMLDMFLNDNGNALADGSPLPVCFGTWYWGLGLSIVDWEPAQLGKDYELPPHLQALAPVKDKINLYSGSQVFNEGVTTPHFPGAQATMTGISSGTTEYHTSLDALIAEQLGVRTRFRSIEVASGGESISWSARSKNAMNTPEMLPQNLYNRIFVDGFQDPNAATFTPDKSTLLRKSALSVVKEERHKLITQAGGDDRTQLEEFFTSFRELEQRLALELEKPEPMEACDLPNAPDAEKNTPFIDDALVRHQLFLDLIAHALSCGQTRIFNIALSTELAKRGDPANNHIYTHEEAIDPKLGYQPMSYWFAQQLVGAFRDMVLTLDRVKEGDGTLLDRTLVMAYSDQGDARLHGLKKMPLFTAGRAGGGMKTGLHVSAGGAPSTMLGLTCQQALGLPTRTWGKMSNKVSKPFYEVLA